VFSALGSDRNACVHLASDAKSEQDIDRESLCGGNFSLKLILCMSSTTSSLPPNVLVAASESTHKNDKTALFEIIDESLC
jgi:hypothetical protein